MYPQFIEIPPRSFTSRHLDKLNYFTENDFNVGEPLEALTLKRASSKKVDAACDLIISIITTYWRALVTQSLEKVWDIAANRNISKRNFRSAEINSTDFNEPTRHLTPHEIELLKKAVVAGADIEELHRLPANDGIMDPLPVEERNQKPICSRYEKAIATLAQFCVSQIINSASIYEKRYWLQFGQSNGFDNSSADLRIRHSWVGNTDIDGRYAIVLSDGKRPALSGVIRFFYGDTVLDSDCTTAAAFYAPGASKVLPKSGLSLDCADKRRTRAPKLYAHDDSMILVNRDNLNMPISRAHLPAIFPAPHRLASVNRALMSLFAFAGRKPSRSYNEIAAILCQSSYLQTPSVSRAGFITFNPGLSLVSERVHLCSFERSAALFITNDSVGTGFLSAECDRIEKFCNISA